MKFLKTLAAALALSCSMISAATAQDFAENTETEKNGATYIALVWINPAKMEKLQEYELGFQAIMAARGIKAKPFGIFGVEKFNTQWPNEFAYRKPDRIDVVYFEDGDSWPKMQQSKEWKAIQPLRDEALERIVLFRTGNLLDIAHTN